MHFTHGNPFWVEVAGTKAGFQDKQMLLVVLAY
jgi:hypothetical protein